MFKKFGNKLYRNSQKYFYATIVRLFKVKVSKLTIATKFLEKTIPRELPKTKTNCDI